MRPDWRTEMRRWVRRPELVAATGVLLALLLVVRPLPGPLLDVLLAASLSFIGAGVRAPTPEWGSMIAMGFQNVVTGQWWPSIFPGLALALTVFGLGRIGASILSWSNPRDRSRPSRRAWKAFAGGRG